MEQEKEVRKWKKGQKKEKDEFEESPLGKARAIIKELEAQSKLMQGKIHELETDLQNHANKIKGWKKRSERYQNKYSKAMAILKEINASLTFDIAQTEKL